jgi:hypothetical protein
MVRLKHRASDQALFFWTSSPLVTHAMLNYSPKKKQKKKMGKERKGRNDFKNYR